MSHGDASRYEAALQQLVQGKAREAARTLNTLSTRYPGNAGVWLNLATAYYLEENYERTTQTLNEAESYIENLPHTFNLRGLMAARDGDYQGAAQYYQKALEVDPQHAQSHYNLALLYDVFYQDIEAALPHYQRYLSLIEGDDGETASWVKQIEASLARGTGR